MADVQRKVINGVNTIVMHGKAYVEVAERVRLVYDQKREFEVVESAPFSIGDRCLWRVVVKVDGKCYVGNAEAKLNARSGPDSTNPFECAETSALGRALAFAGFGSVESIASFDEVYRAQSGNGAARQEEQQQSAALHDLLGKAKQRAKAAGLAHDKASWAALVESVLGGAVEDAALTLEQVARLNGHLTTVEKQAAKSAA